MSCLLGGRSLPLRSSATSGSLPLLPGQFFPLSAISDLSLTGYEFHDDIAPSVDPQARGNAKESKTVGREVARMEDETLKIFERLLGNGAAVEGTSTVAYSYIVLDKLLRRVGHNDENSPVR